MSGTEPQPTGPAKSSWKREVPPPWIDCAACGWRHYPDTGQRRGPHFPETCASCGQELTLPSDDEHVA